MAHDGSGAGAVAIHRSGMCTRALWATSGQGTLVGRNMDWLEDLGTNLWVLPRGARRVGVETEEHALRWTAEYGSVITSAHDLATSDGMNEKGFAAHLLWLTESNYGAADPRLPAVSASLWCQLFLDRFATVADAVEFVKKVPFQVRPQVEPHSGKLSTVHLALDDAQGDSAILEYLDGRLRVHHDRTHRVMTNSPPFEEQLEHLGHYEGFGGAEPLPGTTEPADRFVRARYYLERLPPATSPEHAYAALLSVMRNAAQPFGIPDPARPHVSMTIWRTLADLTRRIYAFESSFRPNIVWVHLTALDFTRTQKLDLTARDLVGDVTKRFRDARPFPFLIAA